ncbi:MAG TPA: SCO family protein [Gaiellales bacterium]|nr:SCO family protein [Gaiellales bacterium]
MTASTPTGPAPPRRKAAVEAAALALVVAGIAFAALLALTPDSNGAAASGSDGAGTSPGLRWTLHNTPAPAVQLPDQDGKTTSLAALRGHTVLLTFLDSRCTNLCPIEGSQLAAVQRRLPAGQRPALVVISVNPADTRASVARFVRQAGWTQPWRWLLGTRSTLAPVWRAYHIGVRLRHGQAVQTGKTTIRVAGDVVHTIALYVIDPKGQERYGYLPPFRPAAVAAAVSSVS